MSGSKGFSLIELLTALAIVSILAFFILPSVLEYKVKAKVANITDLLTTCASELAIEYADNSSVVSKVCRFPNTTDTCLLKLVPETGKVILKTEKCSLHIDNTIIECTVEKERIYCKNK